MNDLKNTVTLDRRDLFDAVRSAVKHAMVDQGSREDDSELYGDATNRTEECLRELYASEALIKPVENGGPAFGEFKQAGELSIKTGGVTVRDYFAAKALTAMITNTSQPVSLGCNYPDNNFNFAMAAYAVADAMLAARGESK